MRRRLLLTAATVVVLAGGVPALVLTGALQSPTTTRPGSAPSSIPAMAPAGSSVKFADLSRQHSNRCGLQAAEIRAHPDRQRLQGSCCSPMDEPSYQAQVAALRRYAAIPEIPTDPYDIPAGLVKELLHDRAAITLSPAQATTYRQAMQRTPEQGPCCCHCWRWDAFEGLGKFLIARKGWSAPELARLIAALDGCGGRHTEVA